MTRFVVALLLLVGVLFAKVDINNASAKDLQTLKGVGDKKAQMIVDYRVKNGEFKSVEDLMKVDGIGKKIIEDNKKELEVKPMVKPAKEDKPAQPADTKAKK